MREGEGGNGREGPHRSKHHDARTFLSGLAFVFLAALVYSAIHVGFRLLASDVLGEDDVIDNVLVQDLRVAYDAFPRQPPLYDWVLWGVQRITGTGVSGFLLIKYTALIATTCLLYLASMRVLKDRLFSILCVESLALIYQISWRFHEGFTHEVGAMVAVMATAWLFLRLLAYERLIDFVLLGVCVGLGLLTEPAFGVFFLTLVGAGLLQPAVRRRFVRLPFVLTLLIAIAVVSPYLYWLASEPHRIAALMRPTNDFLGDALRGFGDAVRGPIAYLSPLLFILPLVFPGFLRTAWGDLRRAPNAGTEPDLPQLFLHSMLLALGLSIFGALAFAIKGLAVHVLMPLYVVSVIWLFSVAQRSVHEPVHVRRFTRLAIGIAGIALAARLANMFVLDPVCKKCRWGIPYSGLGVELRARGFDAGTIVSIDHELAGNLRALFPDARIITRRYPRFAPDGTDARSGPILFVWGMQLSDATAKTYMGDLLPDGWSFDEADVITMPWRHLYKPDGYRVNKWKVLLIPETAQAN